MATNLPTDAFHLDPLQRRTLEQLTGFTLADGQVAVVVADGTHAPSDEANARPKQSIEDWVGLLRDLDERQVAAIDCDVRQRAELFRDAP